jgi:hypothetical protein
MHTDQLLDSCLQAISSGQEIPPDIARYLARHHEQRAEVEELILIVQRASQLPPAALPPARREKMRKRLAAYMGVDQAVLAAQPGASEPSGGQDGSACRTSASTQTRRWRLLATAHLHLARLRDAQPTLSDADEEATARIRKAFCDLTPDDIRRYIGDRGEDYLYYRQRFPRWEPVFAVLAAILRGFKRLEKLTNTYS